MKTDIPTMLLCIIMLLFETGINAQESLQEGFRNPPASARARTWWHWVDGNVSREGITADLEAMKEVGIQEVQMFNVGVGFPQGQATYLSPQWMELVKFAASESKRLGLELGFHNCAGWSSSGGPWITPEYAMQEVVYRDTTCMGGCKIDIHLSQPLIRLNYYRDIAVLAFPKPKSQERIVNLEGKSLSGKIHNHLYPEMISVPQSAVISKENIIDLTSRMDTEGRLIWDVPEGEWTILRIGYTPTASENRPAAEGGRGLECDKMSKKAVDKHWAGGIVPILKMLGEKNLFTNCVIDSYEVGTTNWTAGFEQEFYRLRKYDCRPYLPVLAGYYVDGGEISERFLYDFRQTIGELIKENYYEYFRELCHKYGMILSVEPYWGPFNSMNIGDAGDVVMGEFWTGDFFSSQSLKIAASCAHLNGTQIAGAESFTGNANWLEHPATLKNLGDRVWTTGINRIIFHTYTHQPGDVGPGYTMGGNGLEFNRLNTWWKQGKAFLDYIARSQYLLQQGKNVADVLVFTGEASPNDATLLSEISAMGFDYDLIGTDKMMKLTAQNGVLRTDSQAEYRILVLPESVWMTPEVLSKIEELVKNNVLVIGKKPQKSPSLEDYPHCDNKLMKMAKSLWGKGLIKDISIQELVKEKNFISDFTTSQGFVKDISYTHRRDGEVDIYFVDNARQESLDEICRFRVGGKQPELWNPETGEIREIAVWKDNGNGTTDIPLHFESDEAFFVVFRNLEKEKNHFVDVKIELNKPEEEIFPGLEIIKAEYGTFMPVGLVDVTQNIRNSVRNGSLNLFCGFNLSSSDPAPGYIKEVRIDCEIDEKRQELRAKEGEQILIRAVRSLEILNAVYGRFEADIRHIPQSYAICDVTDYIKSQFMSGMKKIPVDDNLVKGNQSDLGPERELHIVYSIAGKIQKKNLPMGTTLDMSQPWPVSRVLTNGDKIIWTTPIPGSLTYTTVSGKKKSVQVSSVPQPIRLTGPWNLCFPQDSLHLDELVSWTNLPEESMRYFSGTAVYKKTIDIPKKWLRSNSSVELDLGNLAEIAEVIINGKNMGILWKPPYRINLGDAVHGGKNDLEIKITNLWPNRLIGDENNPDSKTTFSTIKVWGRNSPLLPSGLLGPVIIRPYQNIELK